MENRLNSVPFSTPPPSPHISIIIIKAVKSEEQPYSLYTSTSQPQSQVFIKLLKDGDVSEV
ncbi:MAG: hypothetical protein D3925_02595, partial [Candidatus Electrothrix sp. AR5]|nr:hypothetical protein [Candidatus Electrothrix sp. AR5]